MLKALKDGTNGRKAYLIVLVLAWAIIVIGGSRYLLAIQANARRSTEVKTTGGSKPGDAFYGYGFSLKRPANWVELDRSALRLKDPSVVAGFRRLGGDNQGPSVIVKIERADRVNDRSLLDAVLDKLENDLEGFREESSSESARLGDLRAIDITYSWGPGSEEEGLAAGTAGDRVKQRMVIGVHGGWAYYLILSSSPSAYAGARGDFERFIGSFKPAPVDS